MIVHHQSLQSVQAFLLQHIDKQFFFQTGRMYPMQFDFGIAMDSSEFGNRVVPFSMAFSAAKKAVSNVISIRKSFPETWLWENFADDG